MAKEDYSLTLSLKDIFPEDTWSWAIPSLMREGLIWERLKEEPFRDKARKEIGSQPQHWSPARLGTIAVNLDLPYHLRWPLPPFNDLDPELRQRIYSKYQEFTDDSPPIHNLSQALLIALGIQQEKATGKTWQELLTGTLPPEKWQGALVCLYELLDSPAGLLKTLPDALGFHIAFSKPASPAAMKEKIRGHLALFDRSKQLAWLEMLREEKPAMVPQLAKTLTANNNNQPDTLIGLISDSELHLAADDAHQALQMLKQASSLHHQLKGKLSADINAVNAKVEAPDLSSPAWQDVLDTVSDPAQLATQADAINNLLQILVEKQFFAAAENLVETMTDKLPDHPGLLSNLAAFALSQDEPEKAQRIALQTLEVCDEDVLAPPALCAVFYDLGLYEEAIQAARSTLSAHPAHTKTLRILSQAEDRLGDHSRAAQHAQIAVLSQPEEIELRRQFATYLEHDGKWEDALEERSLVLAKLQGDGEPKSTFEPVLPEDDLHALANCAYHAQQPARAVKVCENLLEKNPDDGLAHATMGKSLRLLGDDEQGFRHLEKAADKAPHLADPWLALAKGYAEKGDVDQALHTLKMGASAADQRSKIFLAQGKLHQERQAKSEALEAFQKSARLAEEEGVDGQTEHEIGYHLGKTYYQLGHLKEARDTLRGLKERFPGNPKTHYMYGQLLLEMDEPRGALPYLAQVVDTKPPEAAPYIDYADAHLQIGANPKIAIKTLDKALHIDPQNEKAQALLAEAYTANGEHERALSQFQKALDSELSRDPTWGPRITMGFGSAALEAGQIETALATLQEGFQTNPHHLELGQTLAKAFAKADLRNDALAAARDVLDIAPDDMENLAFVSEFALDLNAPDVAIPALQEMTHLEPERTETYIKLGKAHRQNDDPQSAREVFSKITSIDTATPDGLFQSGDALLEMGDIEPAMSCLEKAANISKVNDPSDPLLSQIQARLADGVAMNGNPEQALELLDQAIAGDLNEPRYRIKKADLLAGEERYQAALASLKNAVDLAPREPSLYHKIALLYRKVADYSAALDHAQRAVELERSAEEGPSANFSQAIGLVAELASAVGQPELAYKLLNDDKERLLNQPLEEDVDATHALCMLAELALENEEDVQAADLLNQIMEGVQEGALHRLAALQARILARQGKVPQAHEEMDKISTGIETNPGTSPLYKTSTYLGIARAYQDLALWSEAITWHRKAAQIAPQEFRAQLAWTRALVNRAEEARFAQTLKAIHHVPGSEAFSEDAQSDFRQALNNLKGLTEKPQITRRWDLRGGVIFHNNRQTIAALEDFARTPRDLAALLAGLRDQHRMDQAAKRAVGNFDQLGEDKVFDAQIALSVININPEKALQAAKSALDLCRDKFDLTTPLYEIVKALAAEKTGQYEMAHQAVLHALEVWEDEPRWHALAADYCQSSSEAIRHLERAIELEPSYSGHYLALGNAFFKNNEPLPAIDTLEQAVEMTPELVEGWISLARCYRKLDNGSKALECAQQAVKVSPSNRQARIMAAETALTAGNHQLAENHLGTLMEQHPHDPQVLALLSQTLAAQNRAQEALQVIEKAIPLSQEPLDLKLQQAELIKEVDGTAAAVDALRVLGSHYPDHFQVVSALVKALADGGETDQAISTAKTILSKDDIGHTSHQKAELHLVAGRLLRKSGQLDQAVHHFNEAKKLDTDSHDPYLELGRTHIERRQYDRALERLNKAIELAPHDAMGYFYAGKVLKELKHYDRAERMLRQASKLAPNDLRIHRQLGVLVTLNLVHGNRKKEKILS